jgi:hypothetical protein
VAAAAAECNAQSSGKCSATARSCKHTGLRKCKGPGADVALSCTAGAAALHRAELYAADSSPGQCKSLRTCTCKTPPCSDTRHSAATLFG